MACCPAIECPVRRPGLHPCQGRVTGPCACLWAATIRASPVRLCKLRPNQSPPGQEPRFLVHCKKYFAALRSKPAEFRQKTEVAFFALPLVLFALANESMLRHNNEAFQASSPKLNTRLGSLSRVFSCLPSADHAPCGPMLALNHSIIRWRTYVGRHADYAGRDSAHGR